MFHKIFVCIILMFVAFSYGQVLSGTRAVLKGLNYQGYLTDSLGSPVDDTVDMTFRIYDAATLGNELWNETQLNVPVERGVFNVILGWVRLVPDSVFTTGIHRWLEVTVEAETLSPRTRFTSASYAYVAGHCDTADYAINGYTATYSDTAEYARNAPADSDWIISGNDMYSNVSDNVGIGKTNPAVKLDVDGIINADSLYMINSDPVLFTDGDNIFVGPWAGLSNTGSWNTFVGTSAGRYNEVDNNTFVGYHAGRQNTTGGANTFVGHRAGEFHIDGTRNTIIGAWAGMYDSVGFQNTIVGAEAGQNNTTGHNNTFLGSYAGRYNTEGDYNTSIGSNAGYRNTTGSGNTFVGNSAGRNNTGSDNTYLGAAAGYHDSTGYRNVFIGHDAGYNADPDSHKLFIENSASAMPLIWGDFKNDRVVIDGNASHNTNNRTFFVNGSAGGQTAWYNDSDERLKKNIVTIADALDKVRQLRGVNFEWKDQDHDASCQHIGFVAQEAVEVIPEVVSEVDGHYTMQYGPVTALLVEALKEQHEIIEMLEERIEALEMSR